LLLYQVMFCSLVVAHALSWTSCIWIKQIHIIHLFVLCDTGKPITVSSCSIVGLGNAFS